MTFTFHFASRPSSEDHIHVYVRPKVNVKMHQPGPHYEISNHKTFQTV